MIHLFPNKNIQKTLACKKWSKEKMCLKFRMLFSNLNKLSVTNLMFCPVSPLPFQPLWVSRHLDQMEGILSRLEKRIRCGRDLIPIKSLTRPVLRRGRGPSAQTSRSWPIKAWRCVETFEVVEVGSLQVMEKSESNVVLFYDFCSYSCM